MPADPMSARPSPAPRVPPRWFVRTAWVVHRALYAVAGGRLGLRRPKPGVWGMVHLRTVGRRSGEERKAILAYLEDGPNLVLMAMNGWSEGMPGWCLNLRAHPEATIDLPDGRRRVRAREAAGEERARLWASWAAIDPQLDGFAARRSETPVIVLEPVTGTPT